MASRLRSCAISLICLLPGISANADTFAVPEYAGAEAGLIGIECIPQGGTIGHRFRGVVIDTGNLNSRHEVILTTAHGFPAASGVITERCAVAGAKDRRYPIRAIWRPRSQDRGAVDDWAVVVTGRNFRERIWRQRVRSEPAAEAGQLVDLAAPIRLPLRFLGAERACVLSEPAAVGVELEAGLFSHTCRSWSGHSGSPVLAVDDDGAFILGIHVGRRWLAEKRQSLRIGRAIDSEILAAVRDATNWRE
jgi:hypothetical protein